MYFILGARDHYTLLETIIQKNMFIGKSRNATFGVFWANTVVTSSDKKMSNQKDFEPAARPYVLKKDFEPAAKPYVLKKLFKESKKP